MLVLTTEAITGRKTAFYKDVINGLKAYQKYLSSKYFYDEAGDKIFQRIMASPEYYPTRCEMEIMQQQSNHMSRLFSAPGDPFDLVELGSGDATKSWYLLRQLLEDKAEFTYYPIDISSNVIAGLEEQLPSTLPGLKLHGLNGDYMDKMEEVEQLSERRKVVLFMGANIGNMTIPQATIFCRQLRDRMRPGDMLLIGFDLKKHPGTVLAAYNDKQGITRDFNLNLLKRINRELDADFDINKFEHCPVYDPGTGACKSYLVSTADQQVHIGDSDIIEFRQHEPIFMEISQKYSLDEANHLGRQSGFRQVHSFFDSHHWFADILWERMP